MWISFNSLLHWLRICDMIQIFFSVFRYEATTGEAADTGGKRPHALGPRVLRRQVDPNHDVPVRAEKHR